MSEITWISDPDDVETDREHKLAEQTIGYVNVDQWFGEPGRYNRAVINQFYSEDLPSQPSENAVCSAMIWQTKCAGVKLAYKAGGDSLSASQYSSSLSVDGPEGERIVLARVFSSDFEDVILTPDKIKTAALEHADTDQKRAYVEDQVDGLIEFMARNPDASKESLVEALEYQNGMVDDPTHRDVVASIIGEYREGDREISETLDRLEALVDDVLSDATADETSDLSR